MPDSRLSMRKLDLSISPYSYQAKLDRVANWLEESKSGLQLLPEAEVVRRVRAGLGSQVEILSDAEIGAEIRSWAERHGYRLVSPPVVKPSAGGEPDFIRRFKRLVSEIPGSVQWRFDQGSATISISGVTAALRTGKTQVSIGRSWDGAIQFKTEVPNAVFAASVSPEKWNLTFTIGSLAPDISQLETVFRKGEAALRGMLAETEKIDWKDLSKTKDQFSGYLDPIKSAVDAAAKTAAQKPGSVNLGVWAWGEVPGAPASAQKGAGIGLRLTVLF